MGQCGYGRPGKEGGIPKALAPGPRPAVSIHDIIDRVIMATFAADALSLAAHWEYRPHIITERLGRVTTFKAPRLNAYHPLKEAGDQSPDGDTAFYLLMTIGEDEKFDFKRWAEHWRFQWTASTAYRDHATKDTLAALEDDQTPPHCASETQLDIGPAARLFPLLALNFNEASFVRASVDQASLTHQQPHVMDCVRFHAQLLHRVLHQRVKPSEELTRMSLNPTTPEWIREKIKLAMDTSHDDDLQAIGKFGQAKLVGPPNAQFNVYPAQACDVEYALPAVLHFIIAYEDNPEPLNAIIRNISIGGHTTARGMMIASILYAHHLVTRRDQWIDEKTKSHLTSDVPVNDPNIHELVDKLTHKKQMMEYLQKLRYGREA